MPKQFEELFPKEKPVIAVVHTGPSPGVPGCVCVESAVDRAIAEADVYVAAGVDGIIVENMRDLPAVHEKDMGPEVVAFMTRVTAAVKRRVGSLPVGVQTLFQANKVSLAVAVAAGCDFVRVEGWTHAHISDKGVAKASAGEVFRYRYHIGASDIAIYADVQKKHASHAVTADLSLEDLVAGMALHRADGVIVTGSTTGSAPPADMVQRASGATTLPVLVGSGVTLDNLKPLFHCADGFIIGSAFKEGGVWDAPVSEERVHALVAAVETARTAHRTTLTQN